MPSSPDLLVLAKRSALNYEPERREVCISITDPDDRAATLSPAFIAVLRVAFIELDEPDDPRQLLFNDRHATAILRFVEQWRDVDRIVIHCMAGQSRSPGIALALCELFGWDAADMQERYPGANPWVRNELVRVGRAAAGTLSATA
jgi:predicted protein tyrosine phosphatase